MSEDLSTMYHRHGGQVRRLTVIPALISNYNNNYKACHEILSILRCDYLSMLRLSRGNWLGDGLINIVWKVCDMQWSAVIALYKRNNACSDRGRTLIKACTHKRHPISRPHG